MYPINSLPVLLSLPIAFYIHTRTCIENLILGGPADEPVPRLFKPMLNVESQDLAKAINLAFPNDQQVDVIDMSPSHLSIIPSSESKYTLYDYVTTLPDGFMSALCFQIFLSIIFALILQKTLIGILFKIFMRRTKYTIMLVPSIPFIILGQIKNKMFVPISDQSESEESEDEFVECSSILLNNIDREESIPKTKQAEQKFLGIGNTAISESVLNKMDNFNDFSEYEMLTSTPRENRKFVNFGNSSSQDGSKIVNGAASPKKLKDFLERKHKASMQLGISFENDGYFQEEHKQIQKNEFDKHIQSFDHSFAEGITDSVWSKMNIFC